MVEEFDPVRKGKCPFDTSKGFGFIIDTENIKKIFYPR